MSKKLFWLQKNIILISTIGLALSFLEVFAGVHHLKVSAYTSVAESRDIYLIDLIDPVSLGEDLKQIFAEVKITNGPRLGEKRVLSNQMLSQILRKHLKKSDAATELRLRIPHQVIIENTGHSVRSDKAKKILKNQWSQICSDCQFEITMLNLPKVGDKLEISSWEIQAPTSLPKGSFTYPLVVRFDNASEKKYWVRGQARVFKRVTVSQNAMQFGQRIRKGDLTTENKDITYAFDRPVTLETAIGRRLKRAVPAGEVIWSQSLEKQLSVRRGQSVKMTLRDGSWSLSLSGVAQDEGQIGDLVSVRNPKSNKVLTGEIIAEGEVMIK